jgi:hypothetical protein
MLSFDLMTKVKTAQLKQEAKRRNQQSSSTLPADEKLKRNKSD